MKGRDPNPHKNENDRSMEKNCRATLYGFWSRETSAVRGNFTIMKKLRRTTKENMG